MAPGRPHSCRLRVENAGERGWLPYYPELQARVALAIFVDGTRIRTFDVPQNIHRGERWHIAFEVTPPAGVGRFELRVRLLGEHQNFSERLGPLVLSEQIAVEEPHPSRPVRGSFLRKVLAVIGTRSE